MTIALTVDGHHVEVEPGASVLDAVNLASPCLSSAKTQIGHGSAPAGLAWWHRRVARTPAACTVPAEEEWPSAPTRRRSCAFAAGCCN